MTRSGKNIGLYLSGAVYGYIARDAKARGIPVTTWVREVVLAACPPDVQVRTLALLPQGKRHAEGEVGEDRAPHVPNKVTVKKAMPAEATDALVSARRSEVLALAARGCGENAIATMLRIPYRVVQEIVTAAKPKTRRGSRQ
jgi:DNA-binding NarL/FixJ family response regulator